MVPMNPAGGVDSYLSTKEVVVEHVVVAEFILAVELGVSRTERFGSTSDRIAFLCHTWFNVGATTERKPLSPQPLVWSLDTGAPF